MKNNTLQIACFFFFLSSCIDNSNKNQDIDHYMDQEIRERIKQIHQNNKNHDSLIIDPATVEKKVNDLITLSKDIENLGASVNLSNQYFSEMALKYQISPSDIKKINTGMHVNDIASTIKQNEMVLFNHVLLKNGGEIILLHTAR